MAAVIDRTIHPGRGTPEDAWMACAALRDAPPTSATQLVPMRSRAVVVAPHPDDEVLAVGGLMSQLARAGRRLALVAVTDGTASHPGSRQWPAERLGQERPREQARALARLGVTHAEMHRLALPDGGVQRLYLDLAERLVQLFDEDDVVFTTWRMDGHPDHEAVGHACAWAAARTGARLVEVPVWGWHWARPDDPRLPWHRARRLELDEATVQRKCAAVQVFESQLRPDTSTGAAPILDPGSVARAARPFELMFA